MKALSIIMPWPWLILHYGKDVENRSWSTNYRGRILLHASKTPDKQFLEELAKGLTGSEADPDGWMIAYRDLMSKCGKIIGSVELVDCVQNYPSTWAEAGMWHWVLKAPVILERPIPALGKLGLWEYKGGAI